MEEIWRRVFMLKGTAHANVLRPGRAWSVRGQCGCSGGGRREMTPQGEQEQTA